MSSRATSTMARDMTCTHVRTTQGLEGVNLRSERDDIASSSGYDSTIGKAAAEYVSHGFGVIPLKFGEKRPSDSEWQRLDAPITDECSARSIDSGIGIPHLSNRTCCVDVDDWHACSDWFAARGVDLSALMMADDAVQICSGREGRAKLLYRLPASLDSLPYLVTAGGKLELRCANGPEQSQQDVLPPSIHPDTGKPYEWGGAGDWRNLPELPDDLVTLWLQEYGQRHAKQSRAPQSADSGVIGAFNEVRDPGDILEMHGYIKTGNRWRYPDSTSGIAGVVVLPNSDPPRVYTHHSADPLGNGHSHDAFSVFATLEHGGDIQTAVKAAAAEVQQHKSTAEFDAALWVVNPDDDSHPDLSHDQLALQLGSIGGWNKRARYVAAWDRWLFWDGSRWVWDDRLRHMTEVREFLRKVARDLELWAKRRAAGCATSIEGDRILKWARGEAKVLRQAGSRSSVESMARSNPELAATVEQWDSNLDLLGTPNGTVDLRKGLLRSASRGDYITKHTAVAPVNQEPVRWRRFLHTAMQGDGEMVAFLQRLAGYMLTGHTGEHKLPFVFGPGGNGKSVFANTLYAIMADYGARAPAEAFLSAKGERHPTDLAGLQGARLVIGSELPAGRSWNESVIKNLTGGDPITARFMRQDFFTFTPQFTLLIVGNHQPSIGAVDEAMRRRLLLIPFTAAIPDAEKDPALEAKLGEEHGAILQWMIDGAVQWYQHGLCVPEGVKAATNEYLEAEDILGQFIEEELVRDQTAQVLSSKVHRRHQAWCDEHGTKSWSQRALTQALRERGCRFEKDRSGNQLKGYRLRERAFPTD